MHLGLESVNFKVLHRSGVQDVKKLKFNGKSSKTFKENLWDLLQWICRLDSSNWKISLIERIFKETQWKRMQWIADLSQLADSSR